jgi:formate hydrogenlyase transcriptional activator
MLSRPALAESDPPHRNHVANGAPDLLREAVESAPIGILIVNTDGVIVLVNRAIERLFGYTRSELLGQSVDVLVPDASRTDRAALRGQYAQAERHRAAGGGPELFGRRRDGSEVAIEVTLRPVSFGDTAFVIASVVDTAERRRVEGAARIADDERMRFEALVGELGAELINVKAADVDRAIEEALGQVVRTLNLDRSALFQLEECGDFVHTHQWTRPGGAVPPPRVSAGAAFPWHLAQIRAGELVSFRATDEVPGEQDRETLRRFGTKSGVTVPLVIGGQVWGALSFATTREPRAWTPDIINRLRVVALLFANVLERRRADEALRRALAESADLRNRLREENAYLRHELTRSTGGRAIVGHSAPMRRVLQQVREVANTDSTVLISGETGTGKALVAARIHELSKRRDRALVRVNCVSPSAAWIEGELFGSDEGSYARAESRRVGRLELAAQSTIVLDEIADLPLDAQAALTRVLQEKQIQPRGSARPVSVDIRVIATTRKDLARCVAEGTFRDDLGYLLNVFPIHVPPLRERPEDIPLLVWRFVDEFSASLGKVIEAIDNGSMAALQAYPWPGNARELRNVVERAMIVASDRRLRIPLSGGPTPPSARAARARGSRTARARR